MCLVALMVSFSSVAVDSQFSDELTISKYAEMQRQVALSVAQIKNINDLYTVSSRDSALDFYQLKLEKISLIALNLMIKG